jgi:transcriptional regulator with XRE-family HTH domain
MGRTLRQKLDKLPKARRSRIDARAAELIGEELSLRALRQALDHTQVQLAKEMGVGQDTISRYEQRTDLMLSTLKRYVSAMGGNLALIAEFPDRKPIRIRNLGELGEAKRRVAAGVLAKGAKRKTDKRASGH